MRLSLMTGSLNIVLYWGWVLWLQRNYITVAWTVQDPYRTISKFLVLITIIAGLFGEGRVRLAVCVAGLLGFLLWVYTGVGVA